MIHWGVATLLPCEKCSLRWEQHDAPTLFVDHVGRSCHYFANRACEQPVRQELARVAKKFSPGRIRLVPSAGHSLIERGGVMQRAILMEGEG